MTTLKERHLFPAGNTSKGFYSFYRYVLSQDDAKRILCIKGGPGTGKSQLIEYVIGKMSEEEYKKYIPGIKKAKDAVKKLNIDRQIKFLGWVSGKEKEHAFHTASIYCLASDGEGFPMGVLDAWAYGIPCVVTPVGGIPDIVSDGKNGLVFPVRDIDALSKKLEILISNEELRKNIVHETDKYVNGLFNIKTINRELDKIYSEL